MKNLGITGQGFYKDRLFLGPGAFTGGGSSKITISSPTCINGVPFPPSGGGAYYNLYTGGQDFICKGLSINSQLLPTAFVAGETSPNQYATYKVTVRDTISLNSGGIIRVDGTVCSGGSTWVSATGCQGYLCPLIDFGGVSFLGGTLGGSGNGGNANASGVGANGRPATTDNAGIQRVFWGGSGGNGTTYGAAGVGHGGTSSILLNANSIFQPSVYLEALIYEMENKIPAKNLAPYKINGGCGGGGSSYVSGNTGGGAAGGGVCFISCGKLVMNGGSIDATGGTGSAGGGGGGLVIINAGEIVWEAAGAAGNIDTRGGVSGGYTGSNGSDGLTLIFSNSLVAQFSGLVTLPIYQAAVRAYNSDF